MTIALRRLGFIVSALCLAGACATAWAQAAAGRFLSVTGDVSVVAADGTRRTAERGSEIQAGETVVTGEGALAQMRMADRSLFSLRGGSEFKLDEFSYAGKDDRNASFVVSVLKGGFRTITGLIAQINRRNYRITTPSATIGVRGTHFEVVHVLPQIASQEAPAGTYNRVYEGITTLQNPAGLQLLVSREQTAFAALQAGAAPVLVAPPAAIFGQPTPIPRAAAPAPQGPVRAAGQAPERLEARPAAPGIRPAVPVVREGLPTLRDGAPTLRSSPTLTPLEPTTAVRSLDPSTTISPTTTILPTTTLSPILTPLEPTTTLRTLEPATTTISPTTTTILQAPSTTTIAPATTTVAPATTTISPTSPILQSPTTTTIRR